MAAVVESHLLPPSPPIEVESFTNAGSKLLNIYLKLKRQGAITQNLHTGDRVVIPPGGMMATFGKLLVSPLENPIPQVYDPESGVMRAVAGRESVGMAIEGPGVIKTGLTHFPKT
ncbi:hypothetical protein KGQ71_03790 [Patescibacteria group bacterium]|nr:hypothetical protein [Patescibacteria group bacterium]